jgi:hypothetical protein
MTDDEIQSRIDELIAELTPAEKAGQLTQYFYFGSIPETDAEQISHRRTSPVIRGGAASSKARAKIRSWVRLSQWPRFAASRGRELARLSA